MLFLGSFMDNFTTGEYGDFVGNFEGSSASNFTIDFIGNLVKNFHRYLKKSISLKFVMWRLLALPFPRVFLQQPLTILTRETR